MKKNATFIVLVILICLVSSSFKISAQRSHLDKARHEIAAFRINAALAHLDTVLMSDPQSVQANYMKAEILLLSGSQTYKKYMGRLEQMNYTEGCTVLRIKEAVFTGKSEASEMLAKGLSSYPGNGELKYLEWLIDLDRNGIEDRAWEAGRLSEGIIVKPLPLIALYGYARDRDPALALKYLDSLDAMSVTTFQSRDRPLLELLAALPKASGVRGEIELEYAECGAGMGFYMYDTRGNKIKMELDTGSGSSLFTIHNDSVGEVLDGRDLLSITDGIWYNYMEKPADIHYKTVDFSNPAINNIIAGYFDSSFSKADGCYSPFSLGACAITLDPVNGKAWIRDSLALDRYLSGLAGYTGVEYILRNGWIYIPCKINGKEVLMMVETGSRDVNLNKISVPLVGVEPYQGSIKWRGADYPVTMADFILEVGEISYEVKSGLVSDFVLGNKYTGLASAGDIGPDFFRNFIFTIDPFSKRLIIEHTER